MKILELSVKISDIKIDWMGLTADGDSRREQVPLNTGHRKLSNLRKTVEGLGKKMSRAPVNFFNNIKQTCI